MPKSFYVYTWTRPDTGDVFYVGKGHGSRDKTLYRRSKHFLNIVGKLKRIGHEPIIKRIAENLTEEDAFDLERSEIARIGRSDLGLGPLVNSTDGGDGASGAIVSLATRAKKSASLKGIPRTQEWLENMSAGLRGNKNALGAKRSKITRARMSKAKAGKKMSLEARAKRKALGLKHSPETRLKISQLQIGKKISPESIAKKVATARKAGPRSNGTSGYKGVSFHRGENKWVAYINHDKRRFNLGLHATAESAAIAYDAAAYELWGDDCYLNLPELVERKKIAA